MGFTVLAHRQDKGGSPISMPAPTVFQYTLPVTDPLPGHLRIVHAGDHGELVNAIEVIAKYQRDVKRLDVLEISETKDADELADYLTRPAAIVLFTGHGTRPPYRGIGTQSKWHLDIGDVENTAGRQFSAHGLIIDACYGWDFRDSVRHQSSSPLAYLGACGEADYADTQLIVNVVISLIGDRRKPLPRSADDADYAFCQALGPACGRWRHCLLEPARAQ